MMYYVFNSIFGFWYSFIGDVFNDIWFPFEEGITLNLWTADWNNQLTMYGGLYLNVADIICYLLSAISVILIFYMLYRICKLIICRIANV